MFGHDFHDVVVFKLKYIQLCIFVDRLFNDGPLLSFIIDGYIYLSVMFV